MAGTETIHTDSHAADAAEANQRFLIGKFWNPDDVLTALKHLKEDGIRIYDVYSPFPIHGIEPYLDIKRTRLTIAAFIYGCLGFLTAVLGMSFIYGIDWPMNIGGKTRIALGGLRAHFI